MPLHTIPDADVTVPSDDRARLAANLAEAAQRAGLHPTEARAALQSGVWFQGPEGATRIRRPFDNGDGLIECEEVLLLDVDTGWRDREVARLEEELARVRGR